ncbi:MAG: hypothetical protein OHK0029_03940 [Armatimonadaceae bacterium]
MAILLMEQAMLRENSPSIQVFATDMDADAIARARDGVYPETISADVSPERLRRWFYRDNGTYRVRKEIREPVLFAVHDVLKDTPFSRLDLITCRNLLIYLNRPAQERIFDIYHFALQTEGALFLGGSESADSVASLFYPADKRHRIYRRRPVNRPIPPVPVGIGWGTTGLTRVLHREITGTTTASEPSGIERMLSLGELHRNLLELYAPPSILVDQDHRVMHVSESAARYLRFPSGEPTTNLLRVIQPALRLDVSTALYSAASQNKDQTRTVRAELENIGVRSIRITARPVPEGENARGYFLLLLEDLSDMKPESDSGQDTSALPIASPPQDDRIPQLEEEINRLQGQLRGTIDQYEASLEELKSANEEQQAINEELRSAAEELETSKEELQSVNEELNAVNQELKNRVEEVSRTNADLHNLLISTDIATIFLDRSLRIKRYTPAVETLFNIIPTDIGRPLAHITHQLDYSRLLDDAQEVLERLSTLEREVGHEDGRHMLVRLLPYRTMEDRIDGVVITFIEITQRKRADQEVRLSEERFRTLANLVPDLLWRNDPQGSTTWYNDRWLHYTGQNLEEASDYGWLDAVHPEDRQDSLQNFQNAMDRGQALQQEHRIRAADGTYRWFLVRAEPLRDKTTGKVLNWFGAATDIHEQRLVLDQERVVSDELRQTHEEVEARVRERTTELDQANQALRLEMVQRAESDQQRDMLLKQLVTTQEEERRRISRELHDQMGQHLTAFLLGLANLQKQLPEESEVRSFVERLQQGASNLSQEIHYLAWDLRPLLSMIWDFRRFSKTMCRNGSNGSASRLTCTCKTWARIGSRWK